MPPSAPTRLLTILKSCIAGQRASRLRGRRPGMGGQRVRLRSAARGAGTASTAHRRCRRRHRQALTARWPPRPRPQTCCCRGAGGPGAACWPSAAPPPRSRARSSPRFGTRSTPARAGQQGRGREGEREREEEVGGVRLDAVAVEMAGEQGGSAAPAACRTCSVKAAAQARMPFSPSALSERLRWRRRARPSAAEMMRSAPQRLVLCVSDLARQAAAGQSARFQTRSADQLPLRARACCTRS